MNYRRRLDTRQIVVLSEVDDRKVGSGRGVGDTNCGHIRIRVYVFAIVRHFVGEYDGKRGRWESGGGCRIARAGHAQRE